MASVSKMTTPRQGLRCRQLRYLKRFEALRPEALRLPLAGDLPLLVGVKRHRHASAMCLPAQTPLSAFGDAGFGGLLYDQTEGCGVRLPGTRLLSALNIRLMSWSFLDRGAWMNAILRT
jgi:hypothetical protein